MKERKDDINSVFEMFQQFTKCTRDQLNLEVGEVPPWVQMKVVVDLAEQVDHPHSAEI